MLSQFQCNITSANLSFHMLFLALQRSEKVSRFFGPYKKKEQFECTDCNNWKYLWQATQKKTMREDS